MAYSNYEGRVWRNGEHFHDGCSGEVTLDREARPFMYHALLGQGPVRVGLRKTSAVLLTEHDDDIFGSEAFEGEWRDGSGFRAVAHSVGGHAAAVLIEPDGTVWTGLAAYEAFDDWCEDDEQ